VSEKLAAFVTLYNERAAADVESAKEYVKKSEDKLKRSEELWELLNVESEKLGVADKFLSAFPEPGGESNVTVSGFPNPNYTTLLDYGDPMKGWVKELTKLRNAKQKLEGANNRLSSAETILATKPEDHLNNFGSALVSLAAGAGEVNKFLKTVFESYENYESIGYRIEEAEGPSRVNISEQAYEVLKEKFESGSIVKKSEETDVPVKGEASEEAKAAAEEAIAEAEKEESTSPINEPTEGKEPFGTALAASPINIPETSAQAESVTSDVATTSPELNQTKVSDQIDLIANINVEQTGAAEVTTPPVESTTPINEAPVVTTTPETGEGGTTEVKSESTSSFMNVDFSKMSAEEIVNSFMTGDVFGETKNEFSNIFGGEIAATSPINEAKAESIPEKKEEGSEDAPVVETTSTTSPVNEAKAETTSTTSSFMNVDFSKMSAEEIANSFMTGDIFGETKNEFSNIFGEEMKPKAAETTQATETTETGGFLSNIFSRGREKKAEETVERGATKMNAPIISTTSAPVSQENSSTNVTTNQPIETIAQSETINNQTSNVSNISNDNSDQSTSENMSSNQSSMMQGGSDNSDIVNRLRRIERLLSGPLEVKIIES
jgi:hypothetical protein